MIEDVDKKVLTAMRVLNARNEATGSVAVVAPAPGGKQGIYTVVVESTRFIAKKDKDDQVLVDYSIYTNYDDFKVSGPILIPVRDIVTKEDGDGELQKEAE